MLEQTLAIVAFLSSNWNPTSNSVFSLNGNTSHALLLPLLLVQLHLHLLHVLGQRTFYVSTWYSRLSLESQILFFVPWLLCATLPSINKLEMLHQRLQSLQRNPCWGSKNPQLSPKFPVRTDTIFKTTHTGPYHEPDESVHNPFSLYFKSFAVLQMEWFIRVPYQYFLACPTAARLVNFIHTNYIWRRQQC